MLRVVGTAQLPAADDLIATRIDHFQRQRERTVQALDALTHNQLQHGGLECHILGTFYIDRDGELRLGSDVESFSAAGNLNVFRPRGEALASIVNFLDPDLRRRSLADLRILQQTPTPTDQAACASPSSQHGVSAGHRALYLNRPPSPPGNH